jgi:hypothetical protein
VKADGRIVPRATNFVGILAVIRLGRKVDEENFLRGDGLEAVEDARRNLDQNSVMFSHDNAMGFALGWTCGAIIKKADLGHAVDDRDAVRLFLVGVPSFDDARVDRAEISLTKSREVWVVLPQDFHHSSSVIAMLSQRENAKAIDHGCIMEDWPGVERLR